MRRRPGLIGVILVAAVACRSEREVRRPDDATRRTTPSGDVVGYVGPAGSDVWLGLPYAAPPVGDLRWREPAPPAAWSGVREALQPRSSCVQYASAFGGDESAPADTPVGDEDCLYANVYAPRTATPTSFLPVMVWIHGGGNTIGTSARYDGGTLATTQNVVVVTVNYRLGPFGWFRQAALRTDAMSDAERSGNFATLDLVRALEWVQTSITAFGGDPAKVTVFGESAGGANTLALLLTPSAIGLFHRAIVQSGGYRPTAPLDAEAFADDPTTPERANSSSEAIARLLVAKGRARDRDDAKSTLGTMPRAELATWLRAQSARDILAVYTPLPNIGMILMPTLFGDDTVLPSEPPLERLRRAEAWNRVPVVIGTNRDESKLFMFGSPFWVKRWLGFLPRLIEPEQYDLVAEYASKTWKASGADEIATAMVASGFADVFAYRFDWDEEPMLLGSDLSRMLGAAHGFEIPFVFGHFDLGREANRLYTRDNEPGRTELSTAMMSYWAAFATFGRPGGGRDGALPAWPAWQASAPSFLVLDTKAGGGIRTSSETLTTAGVTAAVATDPRLATERDRCLVYHDLVMYSRTVTRAVYDARCPGHPFDGFPWR